MRHRIASFVIALAAAVVMSPQAEAQGRPVKLGGALGATLPIGDFGDVAKSGFHVGGLLEWSPSTSPVGLRGEVTYHANSLKDDLGTGYDADVKQWAFLGNALFMLSKGMTAQPYLIGGLGMYSIKGTQDFGGGTIGESSSESKFGFNVGGGIRFPLSGFTAFVEGRFHSVQTEFQNTNFIPLSFGILF